MPILLGVLASSDQKVVEQGSLCVSRIVESFKYQQDKLEELVSADLLKAIRRLLLPGTTNLIGPNIHTQFLRVLAITARASPTLSAELFKMSIVDTLFQILTGVSPPNGVEDVASKIDTVVIMQALIHRPREHVYETLNVICELLPGIDAEELSFHEGHSEINAASEGLTSNSKTSSKKSPDARRTELLNKCKEEVKRFAIILLPTLTDAYSSTVNLSVRQKVLTAQLKMLSNLDTAILEDALRMVPYASYLASILSQQDHPSLVTFALQAAELLLVRLPSIYRYQFYREGVMAEIVKLANQPLKSAEEKYKLPKNSHNFAEDNGTGSSPLKEIAQTSDKKKLQLDASMPSDDDSDSDGDDDDDDDDGDDDDEPPDVHDDMSPSPSESSSSSDQNYQAPAESSSLEYLIIRRAKKILEVHETSKGFELRDRASKILDELKTLAANIEACYLKTGSANANKLFARLARHFDWDALNSITSAELLHSGIVKVLLDVFSSANGTYFRTFFQTEADFSP